MTAHGKALPRLHDELNSSHLTIHGASDYAIAAAFALVNAAATFVSPPAPSASDIFHYEQMVRRIQSIHEGRFANLLES